jgi:hypothetical protein
VFHSQILCIGIFYCKMCKMEEIMMGKFSEWFVYFLLRYLLLRLKNFEFLCFCGGPLKRCSGISYFLECYLSIENSCHRAFPLLRVQFSVALHCVHVIDSRGKSVVTTVSIFRKVFFLKTIVDAKCL